MNAPMHETRLRSATREVVIGRQHRFCLIGERINPTGRRIFQDQIKAGDLSAVERDVKSQVEGGADVLDVNMGVPLVDEAELLSKVVTMIQSLTDLPLCIDSSVVEALEAGLSAYNGRALVNSITAEDERMEQILPLVKKYDAAVIALPNDVDEIPMEPDKRLALVEKIVRVATTEYGIAIEDIVIDPLAMPIGADVTNGLATLETMRRIRDTYGLNMTCGASNVSFGMPGRHELNGTFLSMAMTAGLTSAIMDTRTPAVVSAVKATDLLHGSRRVGDGLDLPAPAPGRTGTGAGRERVTVPLEGSEPPSLGNIGREGLMALPGTTPVAHDGTGRVQLSFTVEGGQDRDVRVPPGVTVFDSASWNGIAIDSTCGGHGTCHKCKVRVDSAVAGLAPRPQDLLRVRARGWLAAGLPGNRDAGPEGRGAAADHTSQGSDRGRRTPGDPASCRAEALRRARRPDAAGPAHRPGPADRRDRRPRADLRPAGCCAGSRRCSARPTSR